MKLLNYKRKVWNIWIQKSCKEKENHRSMMMEYFLVLMLVTKKTQINRINKCVVNCGVIVLLHG